MLLSMHTCVRAQTGADGRRRVQAGAGGRRRVRAGAGGRRRGRAQAGVGTGGAGGCRWGQAGAGAGGCGRMRRQAGGRQAGAGERGRGRHLHHHLLPLVLLDAFDSHIADREAFAALGACGQCSPRETCTQGVSRVSRGILLPPQPYEACDCHKFETGLKVHPAPVRHHVSFIAGFAQDIWPTGSAVVRQVGLRMVLLRRYRARHLKRFNKTYCSHTI